MKKLLIGIVSFLMCVSMVACTGEATKEETYTASAAGFSSDVTVTIKVADGKITSCEVDASGETAAVGGAAAEELAKQVVDANGAEIDGKTGATLTSNAVKLAVTKALAEANGETVAAEKTPVADGTYTGKAPSFGVMNNMELAVTFKDGAITNIETLCAGSATQYNEDEYSSIYATVEELMFPRIIASQSLATDSISGATVSSVAAKTIIANIIDENGGNSMEWYTEVEKSTETVTLEGYDVIVVGLGGAGLASYLSAAENGATVFGLETAGKLGGNATNTAGPLAVNPTFAVEANGGEPIVPEDELLAAWMEYTDNDAKEEIVKLFIDESGETLDWLLANYDFGLTIPAMLAFYDYHGWPLWTFYSDSTGTSKDLAFNNSIEVAKAMNEKNDYMKELTATELIVENDEVKGVRATYYDGTKYEIFGDSVILCTGGYIGDAELSRELTGDVWHTKAMTQCDGFAIKESLKLGGALYNPDVAVEDHIAALDTIIRDESVSYEDKALLTSLVLDTDCYLTVKSNGETFDVAHNGFDIHFNAWEAGANYYVIMNEEEYNAIKTNGINEFNEQGNGFLVQGGKVEPNTPIENFDDVLAIGEAYGDVIIADGLADLESKLGFTLEAGEVHGATEGKMVAFKGAAYVYSTTGGVEIDTNINLVKEDGTVVENVYVCGNDSLGTLNESNKAYVTYGGAAQGWALTSGRLAGANAAAKYAD